MDKIEICVQCQTPELCIALLEERCRALNLYISLNKGLEGLPESCHLHIKDAEERSGTLEYTLDLDSGKAWLSIHSNRHTQKPRMSNAIKDFKETICVLKTGINEDSQFCP